eukprot:TRINITY_DN93_c0_g1_i4.p1 TRINITY_DN93_c0_g1~~TRINITY_DN93_c0_g1_i4.p1  ORF type:complete len:308 (-),score=109.18 TRINITY_DN93_c0_g1_i4:26-949(-)
MCIRDRFIYGQGIDGSKIFGVRDCIGDMCSSMASKIRATVATLSFDAFHKSSARTIRRALFGLNKDGHIADGFTFESNNLLVFNADIQNVEPTDENTKISLLKTVTQAIKITTQMQEQEARRLATKIEQEEQGKLDRLIIDNKSNVEMAKKELLQLKSDSSAVKSSGQAIAEANAKAEAAKIAANADVTFASDQSKAKSIKETAEIDYINEKNKVEIEHKKKMNALEIMNAQELATIESSKFKTIMDSIGQQTLIEISNAGPEMQSKMLSSLGLQGYMLMNSDNPVNLFQTAGSMIGMDNVSKQLTS